MNDNEFSHSLDKGTYKVEGGGGIWNLHQHLLFFWWIGLTIRPPSDWIEYVFQVSMFLLYVFFLICIYFFLIHIPILAIYPSINSQRSRSISKIFCRIFCLKELGKNICEKLLKAASFMNFNVISGNYMDRVWAHIQMISFSIGSLLNMADVNRGFCTATRTLKYTSPPHPHLLTQLPSELCRPLCLCRSWAWGTCCGARVCWSQKL